MGLICSSTHCFVIYYYIGRDCGFNSSVMVWSDATGSRYSRLYDVLRQNYKAVTSVFYKFDHFLEFAFMSSSERAAAVGFIDDFFSGKIVDYLSTTAVPDSTELLSGMGMPAKRGEGNRREQLQQPFSDVTAIVTFPIFPKPHNVASIVPWVHQYWS